MTFELLASDFYGYENSLTTEEKELIVKLRAFLEAVVGPIVNGLWTNAEFFPTAIVQGLTDLGLFGQPWPETQRFPNSAVFRGWVVSSSPGWMPASPPWSACRTASSWVRSPQPDAGDGRLVPRTFGGDGIVLDYDVIRYFADAEAIYSYEGTREMNTLIVGRAITGKAAFV